MGSGLLAPLDLFTEFSAGSAQADRFQSPISLLLTNNVSAALTFEVLEPGVAITDVSFATTTLVLGGAPVDYTVTVSNGSGALIGTDPPTNDRVVVQGILSQGGYDGAAGGENISCTQTVGELPEGICTHDGSFVIGAPGNFTVGPATARIEIRHEGPPGTWETLATYDVSVTLVSGG